MMIARSAPRSVLRVLGSPSLVLVAAVLLATPFAGRPQSFLETLRGSNGQQVESDVEDELSLTERQAATDARLAEIELRLVDARESEQTALVAQLEREREILTRLQLRQRQLETALGEEVRLAEELETTRIEVDAYLADESAEFSDADYFALEEARDALDEARSRAALLENTRLAARRQLRLAETAVNTAGREERRAREAIARAQNPTEEAAARQRLREREVSRLADEELLRVRRREVAQVGLRIEIQELVVQRETERVNRMASVVSFTEEEFGETIAQLDARDESLRERREVLQRSLRIAEEGEATMLARISAGGQPAESDQRELETYRIERELARVRLDVVDRALARTTMLRTAWTRRRLLSQGEVDLADCADWAQEADEWLADLDIDEGSRAPELSSLRDRLQTAREELNALPPGASRLFEQERVKLLEDAIEDISGVMVDIEGSRRVVSRLSGEISAESQRVPLAERLRVVSTWFQRMWEYELIPLEDRSITVRKVVLGLTIVLLGGWLARRFSRLLGFWLTRRFEIEEGARAVAQTLTFYALVVLFFLLALKVVNVPLTAFTIFGGAIAIGVGFGSQNLINNFISGLILLLEQPVRVGDLIQVGDLHGVVERIGARSTVVRTGSNIEIVVPNSTFLEKQVVNLTLSESKVRVHVSVGVAYGSPTREVAKLLRRAAEEHGSILKSPKPIVLFEEFGDNALVFEVHFWIRMRRVMDRKTIESDVRFIIDGLFNGAGITIAFPQRDVHVDSVKPLQVHVMTPQPGTQAEHAASAGAVGDTEA